MPERTGNVYVDPDSRATKDPVTGKYTKRPREDLREANPQNVILSEFKGTGRAKQKYGPGVLDETAEKRALRAEKDALSLAAAAGADVSTEAELLRQRQAELDAAPPVSTDLKEPEPEPPVSTGDEDLDEFYAHIKKTGALAKGGDAEATAEMHRIGLEEYRRADGGRISVIRRLSNYGIKKPPPSVL